MSDSERDKTLVQELLELKAKVDGIIVKAFKNNAQFQSVVREGFESVINRRQNKPAELIGTVQRYRFGTGSLRHHFHYYCTYRHLCYFTTTCLIM